MISKNLIDANITKKFQYGYFMHYNKKEENDFIVNNTRFLSSSIRQRMKLAEEIIKNYEELSKNDWELHKKLIKEGVNPNEIAKIIRNDEIDKLQEISSQTNFDFNQKIEPSLYERCSFNNIKIQPSLYANHSFINVTLIDYAAFFSSVKCFKYLLMNGANVENTGKYAVAGGNEEIIHLCEQNHSSFEDAYETAIEFHRNDIFKYIYENKLEKMKENIDILGYFCVKSGNYKILSFLEKEINISKHINESAEIGNLYLVKHFLLNNQIPNNILVFSVLSGNFELVKYILEQKGIDINENNGEKKTALLIASEKGHTEIVKLLLEQKGIDINAKNWYGNTALILASEKGHTEIVKLLLDLKIFNINDQNKYGNTALMKASEKVIQKQLNYFLNKKELILMLKICIWSFSTYVCIFEKSNRNSKIITIF